MDLERPLFWHHGLFLQPQHLQLQDIYAFSALRPFRRYLQQYFWGITGIEVRESALQAKRFEVISGEIVFPDDACITFPGNSILLPRSFEDAWIEGEKPFLVYLGLRKWDENAGNAALIGAAGDVADVYSRFACFAEPEEIRDLHGDGKPAQVKRMNYVLKIFWETEKEKVSDYQLIPIAQLEREGEEIKLSRSYIPPCLSVSASSQLQNILKDIRDQVASRCRQLEEFKSPKEIQTMEFDIGYFVLLLALRSINRHIPQLYQITENEAVHPMAAYGVLRQLIAELSTFSDEYTALGEQRDGTRVLPLYDHENLGACFSVARTLIGQILDCITVGPGRIIRLERQGKRFTAEFTEAVLDDRNTFWLVLRTATDSAQVIKEVDMERLAKLSASGNLSILLARALPGIPLEYHMVPPPGLPRRGRAFHFRISTDSPAWADVRKTKQITFYWDRAPEDLAVEIAILGR